MISNKKEALVASKSLLVDILELSSDSKNVDTIIDLLDMVDDYLRYIEMMDELETIKERSVPKIGNGFVYHLLKEYKIKQKGERHV